MWRRGQRGVVIIIVVSCRARRWDIIIVIAIIMMSAGMILLIVLVVVFAGWSPLATSPGEANLVESINTLLSNMARLTFLKLGVLPSLVIRPCWQFGIG
jgi:hypothetical protein